MLPFDRSRFRKFKTRRKGKIVMTYWVDLMTGHLYASHERAAR
jgi:hypothetical protein